MFERDAGLPLDKVLRAHPMKSLLFALTTLFLVSTSALQLGAQTPEPAEKAAAAQVEVAGVKFGSARFGSDAWMEVEIALDIKPGGRAVSGQFVNNVGVTLSLAFTSPEEPSGAPKLFYRATAEYIALEGGARKFVRFYLPPEVVKRDRLAPPVRFYVVEVQAGGVAQTPGRNNVGSGFVAPGSVQNFLSMVTSEARANEGVLMAQHLTPFAYDEQRASPSPVRRESQR